VAGHSAKQAIAISVMKINVFRDQVYSGLRRHHSTPSTPNVPITYVEAYSHAARTPSVW
jgi:hypothetical protein